MATLYIFRENLWLFYTKTATTIETLEAESVTTLSPTATSTESATGTNSEDDKTISIESLIDF